MFTGIVETMGKIVSIETQGTNVDFTVKSDISASLKVDQSILHNGVCLTVTKQWDNKHRVTAIDETLSKSNLGQLQVGHSVNLEKCMSMNSLLDGHIVQGHVDEMAKCIRIEDQEGSRIFHFNISKENEGLIVNRGSICLNGISLTIADIAENTFYVAIIPYTLEHTNFGQLQVGQYVNVEYDILGKYIRRHLVLEKQP